MSHFHIGNEVRITGLLNSEWRSLSGKVVGIIERLRAEDMEVVQECAVRVGGELRWFMAEPSRRNGSGTLLKFFQFEVSARWKLSPSEVVVSSGDRDELVRFLRDQFDFATRRAAAEVDEFYKSFNDRIAGAAAASKTAA